VAPGLSGLATSTVRGGEASGKKSIASTAAERHAEVERRVARKSRGGEPLWRPPGGGKGFRDGGSGGDGRSRGAGGDAGASEEGGGGGSSAGDAGEIAAAAAAGGVIAIGFGGWGDGG